MDIHIQIQFASDGFPNKDWLAARHALEGRIMERKIGEIRDAGGGEGVMDVVVQVDDAEKRKPEIEAILDELKLLDVSTIRVMSEK
jgi:hypothetical protein